MPTTLKLCKHCRHYEAIGLCTHPQLVDLVDGSATDCHINRHGIVDQDTDTNAPVSAEYCGREAIYFEERPE